MTSKEALGTLTFVLNQLNGKSDRVVNECYDVIEKDLEILELLKKHLYIGFNRAEEIQNKIVRTLNQKKEDK